MKQGVLSDGRSAEYGPSPIPTAEDRRAHQESMRRGLPLVRHKVLMRYERLFGAWRVTFADPDGPVIRECRFEHDATLEKAFSQGRALTCLADRQAMELGMRNGSGAVILQLDEGQYGALWTPR